LFENTSSSDSSLVLLSGGIESATLLHVEAPLRPTTALFVDYGQRAARRERAASRAQCATLGIELRSLDMASVGQQFRRGQTHKLHVPLPHRNLVILSLAVSLASQIGADRILIALNREDRSAYPSAGKAFLDHFAATAEALDQIDIRAPLTALSKSEVIRRGLELGVHYASTYSCLLGYPQQCGSCPQCAKRRAAFAELGMEDPAGFKRPAQ
jgi:7-cyano-7-deazaguanine synthase